MQRYECHWYHGRDVAITHKDLSREQRMCSYDGSIQSAGRGNLQVDYILIMRLELATHQKSQVSMSVAIWDAEKAESGKTFPHYVHGLFHFCFSFLSTYINTFIPSVLPLPFYHVVTVIVPIIIKRASAGLPSLRHLSHPLEKKQSSYNVLGFVQFACIISFHSPSNSMKQLQKNFLQISKWSLRSLGLTM